jgi:hypothetical protein
MPSSKQLDLSELRFVNTENASFAIMKTAGRIALPRKFLEAGKLAFGQQARVVRTVLFQAGKTICVVHHRHDRWPSRLGGCDAPAICLLSDGYDGL